MAENRHISLKTSLGTFIGNETDQSREFLGIPYAKAERFRYCEPVEHFENEFDATSFGNACPQYRQYFPQLDNPERLFYHREFREGLEFHYDEDCLNLNIYAPLHAHNCPVVIYIHGGGFNSGANSEEPFRGDELAKRGIITVFINYRVGIFGYLTHEDIQKEYGRDGNFALDDALCAIRWVRNHIAEFGGDVNNITLCGQSAGAMSIQYLCLNHEYEGLFRRVFMMSGAGLFPEFASPRYAETTREYWLELMKNTGCETLDDLRNLDIQSVLTAAQNLKAERKDTLYNTMPVIDGHIIKEPVKDMIHNPLKIGYMVSYTNCDLYAPLMATVGNQFASENNGYIAYFDIDAPGDENLGFHSCDLRYWFGRLDQSWRPYTEKDRRVSSMMLDYFAAYARSGNPNGYDRPEWKPCHAKKTEILHITQNHTSMGKVFLPKLLVNMVSKGNPKA